MYKFERNPLPSGSGKLGIEWNIASTKTKSSTNMPQMHKTSMNTEFNGNTWKYHGIQ